MQTRIELGSHVRDRITSFEGIATARIEYLTGCVQYAVTPNRVDKDGKRMDGDWIDVGRLVVISEPDAELATAMGRSKIDTPGGPPPSDAPSIR